MRQRVARVAIYCRLSVSSEKSVSINEQIDAARKYAESQGWQVVGSPFMDDGVSATYNKPEDRRGWQALLDSPESFEAVLVWRIDRLSRKVLDFLHADEALQSRGAGIVSVTEPVDMTTAQGRAFAMMLAVFAEMEAEAIRGRVKAARDHLIKAGRVVGGTVPYGWRSVPNADGPGYVLAKDPETIDHVRGMAARALKGESIYSICRWLDDEKAPLPTASQRTRERLGWNYTTVERLLRNPILAGMTRYQPGRGRRGPIDPSAVLRDEGGLPVVDESIAILTSDERRRLLYLLDNRTSPQAQPRASRDITSRLLSRIVACGHCSRVMHRGTTQGRPSLSCPGCHQTVSRKQLDAHIVSRLLAERGDFRVWEHIETTPDTAVELGDIEQAIRDTTASMAADDADVPALIERLNGLKELRSKTRRTGPATRTWRITEQTVRDAWEGAHGDDEQRRVLVGQIAQVQIVKGKIGRYLDPARVSIQWQPVPGGVALPNGSHLVKRVDGTPEGDGAISGILLNLPDGDRLYAQSR